MCMMLPHHQQRESGATSSCVHAPSVVLSQKHDVAVCSPAPFFCISTAVTTYLNGLFRSLSRLMQPSMHCGQH